MTNKRLIGAMGETLAAAHYRKSGFEIIATNYRIRQGEIDVIAKNKSIIVFCEVKTRSENSIASAREFVTKAKQQRVILAALAFISENNLVDGNFRFDVIEINIDKSGNNALNCIENAFSL